jgi:glutamyl/glutaminyl-tRNA synthetase
MELRVRFAPSPTGKIHIGNIRTAIFNWLEARGKGGKFLLRIEDTDLERSTQEAINVLLECMAWLGINYDENPLYQSSMAQNHKEAAGKLLNSGMAYKKEVPEGQPSPIVFRIPWDTASLPFVREKGQANIKIHHEGTIKISSSGINYPTVSKKGKQVENISCLAGFKDLKILDSEENTIFNINDFIDEILSGKVFRFENCSKLIYTRREVFFTDLIKGELAKPLESMKDIIIVRSDGSPVFHLANVCDDAFQKITRIIRGDDHIENTYRHLFIFAALGYNIPEYAHLPMIINQAGKPYSKRDGDAFVGDFRVKGFLPEALLNYLTLLGWAPGDDREKMSAEELKKAFSLERVGSAPSQFDLNKLKNLNAAYVSEMDEKDFIKAATEFAGSEISGHPEFPRVARLMRSRTKVFSDINSWSYFFGQKVEYDNKILKKTFKKDEVKNALKFFRDSLEKAGEFRRDSIEKLLRASEKEHGLNAGELNKPVRVAVTGASGGADILDTLEIIGKDRILSTIDSIQNSFSH